AAATSRTSAPTKNPNRSSRKRLLLPTLAGRGHEDLRVECGHSAEPHSPGGLLRGQPDRRRVQRNRRPWSARYASTASPASATVQTPSMTSAFGSGEKSATAAHISSTAPRVGR